jgi:hypothetical protein
MSIINPFLTMVTLNSLNKGNRFYHLDYPDIIFTVYSFEMDGVKVLDETQKIHTWAYDDMVYLYRYDV